MSNYDEAKSLLEHRNAQATYETEHFLDRASALATLALVDEMRASRAPQISEVFFVQQHNPETGEELHVDFVYSDRTEAYDMRDKLNAQAHDGGAPLRYIVKVKPLF